MRLVWAAILFFVSLPVLYLAIVYFYNWGTVEIVNRSGETVEAGALEVYGQTFDTGPLAPGSTKRLFYRVYGEGAYKMVFRLESGRLICGPGGGYLDGGFPTINVLVLTPVGVYIDRPLAARRTWPCPGVDTEFELAARLAAQGRH